MTAPPEECGAYYGTGAGAATCRRPAGHPPVSEDGVGHSPTPDPRGRPQRIYLSEDEMAALMRDAHGPGNGRVVQCSFGPGAVWLDPATRDERGNYPRWIVLRLAVMRNLDLTSTQLSEEERVELAAFAAEHGRELVA